MNLLVRLALMLLGARRRGRLGLLDPSSVGMRVWPNDLDVQMHMNNGRYLSLMDLGRIDLLIRSGFAAEARRRRWFPLVGASRIEYRRPLMPWDRFILTTRLLGWDDRWFYLEQRFDKGGKLAALATVRAMIRGPAGAVTPAEAVGAVGFTAPSPPLPASCATVAPDGAKTGA